MPRRVCEERPDERTAGAPLQQRIDKWLCHARFFRTRTLAAAMAESGRLRLSQEGRAPERVTKASQIVRIGDVLTFAQGRALRIIRVLSMSARRGPAPTALALYEDLAPPSAARPEAQPAEASGHRRAPDGGRPTKRERRQLERMKTRAID